MSQRTKRSTRITQRQWKLLGTSSVRFRLRDWGKAERTDGECHTEHREKIQLLSS